MKLHHNVASPFVRKVMAVAIETGLDGRLELVSRMMTPVKPDATSSRTIRSARCRAWSPTTAPRSTIRR